jgi:hypothetical protein
MPWRGSGLVMLVWCLGDFLYLDGHLFLKIWRIFYHYFVEYVSYTFGLYLFSIIAHDLQVLSFDEVAEVFWWGGVQFAYQVCCAM